MLIAAISVENIEASASRTTGPDIVLGLAFPELDESPL
jgi:hypothetical protein